MRKLAIAFIIVANLSALDLSFFSSGSSKKSSQDIYDTQNVAGRINNITRFLTDQLTANKNFYRISDPIIAITSLVYENDYDRTNRLGNIIAENLIHEMQVRGFRVLDYKVMPVIKVTSQGDFAISRNIDKLKRKYLINYVLTGTIIEMHNGMILNARIVDLATNIVLSSAQAFIDKKTYYKTIKSISSGDEKSNGKTQEGDIKINQEGESEPKKDENWITPLLGE